MSSDQMPAPGKTKLIKFPPSRAGKDVKCSGYARGDVEASICLIHYRTSQILKKSGINNVCAEKQSAVRLHDAISEKEEPSLIVVS